MTVLPEPTPTAPAAGQATNPLTDAVITAAVDHAIHQARQTGTAPKVVIGNAQPVPQPDSRIAPQWAVGVAIASIGVGAGSTGLGCAAWLACKGLSLVSVPGLERFALIVIAPFVGAAMLVTAVGVAISRARAAATTIHNHGPVDQRTLHATSKGVWVKNHNEQ